MHMSGRPLPLIVFPTQAHAVCSTILEKVPTYTASLKIFPSLGPGIYLYMSGRPLVLPWEASPLPPIMAGRIQAMAIKSKWLNQNTIITNTIKWCDGAG